jgi:predicted transcriptional regulator
VPVIDEAGTPLGMLHESDLLHALLEAKHAPDDAVGPIAAPIEGVVSLASPLSSLTSLFEDGHVGVVVDDRKVVGIVSKIDVIDLVTRRLS